MKTDARFTRRLFLPVLWSASLAFSPLQLSAAEPTVPVPLQQAVDAGDLEVVAIPRDSRQLIVQLINRSDEEIVVAAPAVFAAIPIMGQQKFGGGFNLQRQGGGNQQGGGRPQGVGGQFQGGNQGGGQQFGQFNQQGGDRRQGGFFRIPAGRTVRQRLTTVCLEYGRKDPSPRDRYRIVSLESIGAPAELASLLGSLQRDNQRVMQLATWHLVNDMQWEQLASLTELRAQGRLPSLYTPPELRAAHQVIIDLPESRAATSIVSPR